MELLLKQSVEHLGQVGDVVSVKPGYARNFLLPLGLAVPVTKANLEQIERTRALVRQEEAQRLQSLRDVAARLAETSVTLEGRANEEGHLFGSVTAAQVAAAFRQKGFPIEDRHVRMEHSLKEIGVFDVVLHLHHDLDVTVKVWVVQAKPG